MEQEGVIAEDKIAAIAKQITVATVVAERVARARHTWIIPLDGKRDMKRLTYYLLRSNARWVDRCTREKRNAAFIDMVIFGTGTIDLQPEDFEKQPWQPSRRELRHGRR